MDGSWVTTETCSTMDVKRTHSKVVLVAHLELGKCTGHW